MQEAAERLDRKADMPEGFNLDDYLASGMLDFSESGEKIRLVALFDADAAAHLRETKLSEDQTMEAEDDGRVRVTATVNDTPQLRWWLLAFGSAATVVAPVELCAHMAVVANAMREAYRVPPQNDKRPSTVTKTDNKEYRS